MSQANNDIENENVGTTNNFNELNDNDVKKRKYEQGKKVEWIADELLKKFNADPKSRPFFCKVGWRLSEARIWYNVEQATKPNPKITNPLGLFIYLCKRDGV